MKNGKVNAKGRLKTTPKTNTMVVGDKSEKILPIRKKMQGRSVDRKRAGGTYL